MIRSRSALSSRIARLTQGGKAPPTPQPRKGFKIGHKTFAAGAFAAIVQFGETANGREVVGRAAEHALEFGAGFFVLALVEQGPAEGHARGELVWKLLQAVAAERDGAIEVTGAPEALGDATKGRGVLGGHLPRSIEKNASHRSRRAETTRTLKGVVRGGTGTRRSRRLNGYGPGFATATVLDAVAIRPVSSLTVRTTT